MKGKKVKGWKEEREKGEGRERERKGGKGEGTRTQVYVFKNSCLLDQDGCRASGGGGGVQSPKEYKGRTDNSSSTGPNEAVY